MDAGEASAGSGVVVELVNNSTGAVLTMTTDANGYYRFDNLSAGSYFVRIPASNFASGGRLFGYESSTGQTVGATTATNGYDHGDDTEADGVTSQNITLGGGEPLGEVDAGATGNGTNGPTGDANDNLTLDLGFYPVASFGNFVWVESDNDGIAVTGIITPVVGKVITATDETGTVYTTTTNAAGYYTFTVPANHTYTVNYGAAPAGTSVSATPNDNTASNSDLGTDQQSRPNNVVIVTRPGDVISSIDFGFSTSPSTAIIGNQVWIEGDNDGVFEGGELPVQGMVITATTSTGAIYTRTTDANGLYTFTVPAGTYTLTYGVAPTGTLASPSVGGGTVNTGSPDNQSHSNNLVVTANAGTVVQAADFGFWQPASLGNYVWEDVNHNGQQDAGEPPIAGVLVTLQTQTSTGTVVLTTTTSITGYYQFTNLLANVPYTVTFATPAGYQQTLVNVGGDSADNDGLVIPVTLTMGQNNASIDSGFWRPASLGDRVWLDVNNNGVQDANEPGVANVTVRLFSNGVVVSSTQTNANGDYSFTNLISGTYSVTFALPGGYNFVAPNVGNDESLDSDADAVTGSTGSYILPSGGNEPRVDAGLFMLPQLGIEKRVTTPDGGGDGSSVHPGDELIYTLVARNNGNTVATGVVVTDPLDSSLVEYVAGSAVPAPTRSVGRTLIWELGTLNPGQSREITFRVRVLESQIAVTVITNVAQIGGNESGIAVTSRNSNIVNSPFNPSAVTLASFTATPTANAVRIKWVTLSEIDTWSFALYRAEGLHSGDQVADEAVKVTANAILGEGRGGGGATYEFADTGAAGGKVYTYWLVETETTGRTNVYGPAKWGGTLPTKVYLALSLR